MFIRLMRTNARLRKNLRENGVVFALVRQCYRNTLVKPYSRADISRRKHNRVRGEIISRHRLSSFSPARFIVETRVELRIKRGRVEKMKKKEKKRKEKKRNRKKGRFSAGRAERITRRGKFNDEFSRGNYNFASRAKRRLL